MNKKIISSVYAYIFTIFMLIFILIIIYTLFDKAKKIDEFKTNKRLELHWACMDGCYNMEEILLENISLENVIQREYHTKCANICYTQYVNNTGIEVRD